MTEVRFLHAGWAPVPDVSFYRWDRLPLKPDGTVADDVDIPPDIAIEVVSPGQSLRLLIRRCTWFVEQGVAVTVLVHPGRRSVFLFRPGAQMQTLRDSDRIDLDDVLPGFELTVDELFGFLRPQWSAKGESAGE